MAVNVTVKVFGSPLLVRPGSKETTTLSPTIVTPTPSKAGSVPGMPCNWKAPADRVTDKAFTIATELSVKVKL